LPWKKDSFDATIPSAVAAWLTEGGSFGLAPDPALRWLHGKGSHTAATGSGGAGGCPWDASASGQSPLPNHTQRQQEQTPAPGMEFP